MFVLINMNLQKIVSDHLFTPLTCNQRFLNRKQLTAEHVTFFFKFTMNYCFSGGGNPFGARSPFGQNIDPEDILKSFFGERGSPFGFGASSGGFEDFNQVQQVDTRNWGS